MDKKMPTVSVIIPCYIMDLGLLALAQRTIEAIRGTPEMELVLIDNASLVGSDYLLEMADTYVKNKANLGCEKAVNQGLKLATGDYLATSKIGAIMPRGWLGALFKAYEEYGCGIASLQGSQDNLPQTDIIEGDCFGNCWMVSRRIFEKVGLLDECYLNSFGDTDYFMRIINAGYKSYVNRRVVVEMYPEATCRKIPGHEEQARKNREYFNRKWAHKEGDPFFEKMR